MQWISRASGRCVGNAYSDDRHNPASNPTPVTPSHITCQELSNCHRNCQNCLGPRAEHRVIRLKYWVCSGTKQGDDHCTPSLVVHAVEGIGTFWVDGNIHRSGITPVYLCCVPLHPAAGLTRTTGSRRVALLLVSDLSHIIGVACSEPRICETCFCT